MGSVRGSGGSGAWLVDQFNVVADSFEFSARGPFIYE